MTNDELAQWVDRPTLDEQPQEFQDAVATYKAEREEFIETLGNSQDRNSRELVLTGLVLDLIDGKTPDTSIVTEVRRIHEAAKTFFVGE